MIERERLEELIKKSATVYEVKYGKVITVDFSKNKVRFISKKYITLEPSIVERYGNHKYFKNLFETTEEAKWFLSFGNITRTETLSLPNYTVAINYIDTEKFILTDNSSFKFLLLSNPNNIIIINKQNGNQIFSKPLTKENYIEACEKAKKLFLEE